MVIVDDFTGRLMEGRRWSDGLHQAVEAKEGLKVQQESITYATVTLQNFFRIYEKLAGMTGTAVTEAEELDEIYELDVIVIPTNEEVVRDGPAGLHLPHGGGEVPRRDRRHRGEARGGAAGAGGHGGDRDL